MVMSIGDWTNGSEKFLRSDLKKATTGGSAIVRGKLINRLTTGVWQLSPTTQVATDYGICTHSNVDSDPTFTGLVGGGTGIVVANGAIKPNAPCMQSASTAGQIIELTVPTVSTTPTQADVQAVRDYLRKCCGHYRGHEDEADGSADHPQTDAADTDKVKLELLP